MSSVMYKSDFRTGVMILRRGIIIPCEMLSRKKLRNTKSTDLLESGRIKLMDLGIHFDSR